MLLLYKIIQTIHGYLHSKHNNIMMASLYSDQSCASNECKAVARMEVRVREKRNIGCTSVILADVLLDNNCTPSIVGLHCYSHCPSPSIVEGLIQY